MDAAEPSAIYRITAEDKIYLTTVSVVLRMKNPALGEYPVGLMKLEM